MIHKICLLTLSVLNVNAQGGDNWNFNYKQNGADWPTLVAVNGNEENFCGNKKQSPVNLMQPIGSYGWAYGETVPKGNDNISRTFKDLKKLSNIVWKDHTVGIQFHPSDMEDNFFSSNLGQDMFNTASDAWLHKEFKFKTESEHTINGKHFDLEMQLFFDAARTNDTSTVNNAAVSVLFSVEDYTTTISADQGNDIDSFLDDLQWNEKQMNLDVESKIRFSKFMNQILAFDDRWIYEGSFPEPPCKPGVYWNVLRTVYPIDSDRLEQIKEKMATLSNLAEPLVYSYDQTTFDQLDPDTENRIRTDPLGYYRKLQKINDQNIRYVGARYLGNITALVTGLTSVLAIWASA